MSGRYSTRNSLRPVKPGRRLAALSIPTGSQDPGRVSDLKVTPPLAMESKMAQVVPNALTTLREGLFKIYRLET
jgi:hypothetical protein